MTDYIIVDGVSIVHNMDREEAETYNAWLYRMYNSYKDDPAEYLSYGTSSIVPRESIGDIWSYRVIPSSRYGTKYYEHTYKLQPIKNGELFGSDKVHISVLGRFSNIRNLRIEWNPDKISYKFLRFLKDEFDSYSQNPFTDNRSITSLDLAFDYYDKLFSNYTFSVKWAKKEREWKTIEDNVKESIQFNGYKNCHFNLYNKAIEQGITDREWLRLEYAYNKVSITPEELLYKPNPFMKLSVLSPYTSLEGEHSPLLKSIAMNIQLGATERRALSVLGKTSRYKYKKQLQELMEVTWWLPKPYLRDYYNYGLKDFLDLLEVDAPRQMARRRVIRRRNVAVIQ